MLRRSLPALLLGALLGAGGAVAQTAEGALTLDDRAVTLAHAAAWTENTIPETSGEEAPGLLLHVALTDRPIDPALAGHAAFLTYAAQAGDFRGVLLTLDPASGAILDGDTLLPDEERPRAFDFAGDPPRMRVSAFAGSGGAVEGAVATEGMIEGFHLEGDSYPKAYAVNARFAAPVKPAPPLVAVREDAAARTSGPGEAAAAFLAALGAEDLAATLAMVPEDHPGRAFIEGDLAQAKEDFLGPFTPEEFMDALFKVYEYDGAAVALFAHGDESSLTSLPFTRREGRWMLGVP